MRSALEREEQMIKMQEDELQAENEKIKAETSEKENQLAELAKELGEPFKPDVSRLLSLSFLWQDAAAVPESSLKATVTACLEAALEDWNRARQIEGQALADDLNARLSVLQDLVVQVKERVPQVLEAKREQFLERVRTLAGQLNVAELDPDADRLVQEVAVLGEKLDVSEELTRLDVHLKRLAELLASKGEVGKKLDFTLQETFREINTCGNKCQDAAMSRLVVDFKAELEKCREQVQNLE
jgi:uncharacterized protein (TIGR00255 family)